MTGRLTEVLPTVTGHRGAAALAPENTLAGIRAAKAAGAGMVEFDVKLTADGEVILMHDDRLDRTTTGQGPVREASADEIAQLDAGAHFSPRFVGERVPTLDETLRLALELGLAVNIELKPNPGQDQETAVRALAVAGALWPDHRRPPLISSFRRDSLRTAQIARPDWPRGVLMDTPVPGWEAFADEIDAATIHVRHDDLTPATVTDLGRKGRPVLVYTVNDPARAEILLAMGVASIITDCPDRVAEYLAMA